MFDRQQYHVQVTELWTWNADKMDDKNVTAKTTKHRTPWITNITQHNNCFEMSCSLFIISTAGLRRSSGRGFLVLTDRQLLLVPGAISPSSVTLLALFTHSETATNNLLESNFAEQGTHAALHTKPIAELRSVTCHTGSHSDTSTRHRWTCLP